MALIERWGEVYIAEIEKIDKLGTKIIAFDQDAYCKLEFIEPPSLTLVEPQLYQPINVIYEFEGVTYKNYTNPWE